MDNNINLELLKFQATASIPDISIIRDVTRDAIQYNRDKLITETIFHINDCINKAASEGLYATTVKLFKNTDPDDAECIKNIYEEEGYRVVIDEKNNIGIHWH